MKAFSLDIDIDADVKLGLVGERKKERGMNWMKYMERCLISQQPYLTSSNTYITLSTY